jgi:hypothetical protein
MVSSLLSRLVQSSQVVASDVRYVRERLAGRRTLSMSLAYSSTVAMRQRIIEVIFFECSMCGQASKDCRRGGVDRGDEVFADVLGNLRQLQVSR